MADIHGTTIVGVRNDRQVAIGGDGQVSMGQTIMKGNARKVRRLHGDKVLAGFAGGTADAFTLFERFEGVLETTVIGVPDDTWGEAVKAFVVLKEGARATEAEVIAAKSCG